MEPLMTLICIGLIFCIIGSFIDKELIWYILTGGLTSVFLMMVIYLSSAPIVYGEEKLYHHGEPGSMTIKKGRCGSKRFSVSADTCIYTEHYIVSDEQLYEFVKKDGLSLR